MLTTQKTPALLMAVWIAFACQASLAAEPEEAATLQQQAAHGMRQGMLEHDEEQLSRAMDLAERALALAPGHGRALLTKLQIQLYRHQYPQALVTVGEAQHKHPNDGSLRLLRCMLIDRVQGAASGKSCYAQLEQDYTSQAASSPGEVRHAVNASHTMSAVPFNQVGAAILGDSPRAQALAEAYVAQARTQGGIEAEDVARLTVEALQNGSYVDRVLMTSHP